MDIVLFASSIAYPKEVPETARLIVLCGCKQWARRAEADMPAGAIWRPERAPPIRLARLAAGLIRDFPRWGAGPAAPRRTRPRAPPRPLCRARTPGHPLRQSDAGRISGVLRPTPRPAHSRATRFPAHRADRAQYREARDQAYEAAADVVPGNRACGGGLAGRCGERLRRARRAGREDNADLQPHFPRRTFPSAQRRRPDTLGSGMVARPSSSGPAV